ncbi:MAG: aerobic-type carbon monoxide dehydrogenase, large subunit CoxL/CutL-like protein, partial [Deltaproteobacteria bacterium]|nr:aerobic-type carbon monoxide dehydrogenase, large subunit CoxL/CutL-like protein [Deltaproteobacteria bacterium]
MDKFSLIGKNMRRVDTTSKATGEAIFSADLVLPRMLVGKVLRSPHPHARILNIDTSVAEKLPGVMAVVTAKDTCGDKWGVFRYTQDQQFLPTEKVRYVGEEVAAVAATDEDTALEALELINVEYENLPAVFSIEASLMPNAPLIHDAYPNNINIHVKIDVGDVERGFQESFYIREDSFSAPEDSYFQAEPYAVVAQFDHSGNLEI